MTDLKLFRDLGINESDDILRQYLKNTNNNVELAVNNYFEQKAKFQTNTNSKSIHPPTLLKPKSIKSVVAAKPSIEEPKQPVHVNQITHRPPCTLNQKHCYYLGRRNVTAYTLNSGYLLRSHICEFEVQIKPSAPTSSKSTTTNTNTSNTTKSIKTTKPSKPISNSTTYFNTQKKLHSKDKFSGGKLIFKTKLYHPHAQQHTSASDRLKAKDIQGRLPNIICDFLVPLLNHGLINIIGHVLYDIGSISTFTDVPISLSVLAYPAFFEYSSALTAQMELIGSDTTVTHSAVTHSAATHAAVTHSAVTHGAVTHGLTSEMIDMKEHINSLLIWLQEGEGAIAASGSKTSGTGASSLVSDQPTTNSSTNSSTSKAPFSSSSSSASSSSIHPSSSSNKSKGDGEVDQATDKGKSCIYIRQINKLVS